MSHFSRPMHLSSGYVSAHEETRPVHSTPPPPPPSPPPPPPPSSSPPLLPLSPLLPPAPPPSPSGLYLTAPHTMVPDAANFAALLPVHLHPFLSLLPHFGMPSSRSIPLPFSSPSRRSISSPFFSSSFFPSPFAATLIFVAPMENGAARRGCASRTRPTYNACARSLSKERADSRGAPPPVTIALVGITARRRDRQLSNRLRAIKSSYFIPFYSRSGAYLKNKDVEKKKETRVP